MNRGDLIPVVALAGWHTLTLFRVGLFSEAWQEEKGNSLGCDFQEECQEGQIFPCCEIREGGGQDLQPKTQKQVSRHQATLKAFCFSFSCPFSLATSYSASGENTCCPSMRGSALLSPLPSLCPPSCFAFHLLSSICSLQGTTNCES